jgi:hypothetical protein
MEKEIKVFTEVAPNLEKIFNAKVKIEESREDKAVPGKPMLIIK